VLTLIIKLISKHVVVIRNGRIIGKNPAPHSGRAIPEKPGKYYK
jgi:hypothetical protein